MRAVQGVRERQNNRQRVLDVEGSTIGELLTQAGTVQQLHDEKWLTLLVQIEIQNRNDVGVPELGADAAFAQKAFPDSWIAGHVGPDNLDRHVVAQQTPARPVDGSHAALAERTENLVAAVEDCAWGQHGSMIPDMASLNVPAPGALDFLALGGLVHRLDPGIVPFRHASSCEIHVSGGEYNCAANLSSCFRLRTAIATAMVDYPIGELIDARVRAMGVTPFYKRFPHDGVRGPNMALVYSDRGFGVRPPIVFYNRANEAAGLLRPGDFDWPAIFGAGVRWFHTGGIFASLSETAPDLIVDAMQAARAHGAVVSFDCNYREKLWGAGGERHAASVLDRLIRDVDVLVGAIDVGETLQRFPNLKVVAATHREVVSANRHRWRAEAWIDGRTVSTPTLDVDVFDRVGSGDGFAAGLFYGLLAGRPPDQALRLGLAHGALVMTSPGDTTMATLEEVLALARGGSAEIQR